MTAPMEAAPPFDADRYVSRLAEDGVALFLFHGVIARQRWKVRNTNRKHLPVDDFVQVLRKLRAAGTAVSMDQVADAAEHGTQLPPRAFAVTFDDGFRNNLTVAAPVLADLAIPATYYITSGFVEMNSRSWIDRIEQAMELRMNGALSLPWGKRRYDGAAQAVVLLGEIRHRVKSDPALSPDSIADDLCRQLGAGALEPDEELDAKLTWDQVRDLAAAPDSLLGGHSHSHAILSFLDEPALEREIRLPLQLLQSKAGVRTSHFSYPEGMPHCYSDSVIMALRQAGIRCCPTAEDGVERSSMDPFRLKRIMVT